MGKLTRLYHTVRHLRPIQIYGRLWFRISRVRPDLSAAPPLRDPDGPWAAPAERDASMASPDTFRFLNASHALADTGWDDPRLDMLWRYNLHYFDDLTARNASERAHWHSPLIDRWVGDNPPGRGIGWDPYPTSLRIVNWIKWAQAGNLLSAAAIHSLSVQARWLERRLEYHLLGNHLFANGKALLFAGCFFAGAEADRWTGTALRILMRETSEQILADGGHFELSTLYHALALEDLLDIWNLSRRYDRALPPVAADWLARLPELINRMRSWLDAMCHGDGEIGFFNDAAIGVAPAPARLEAYARDFGLGAPGEAGPFRHLQASGYVRVVAGDMLLLADVARIGPDYLPGHAHADTLCCELSLGGQRFLVNSGTSIYGTGAERHRQRGTAAHNTVTVNDTDSSEIWAGFRVARRAKPFGLSIARSDTETRIGCAHDGYRRLPGRPIHRRSWTAGSGWLKISDRIEGRHDRAAAHFLFHPDLTLRHDGPGAGSASGGGFVLEWQVAAGLGEIEPATFHPGFGQSLPTTRLRIALVDGRSEILFRFRKQ